MSLRRLAAAVLAASSIAACGGGGKTPVEVSPNPVDFGEVVFPDTVTKTVTITNRSRGQLFFQDPRFGCACFSLLERPASLLAPGDSTRLTVLLDSTKTDPRRFKKPMTITLADSSGKTVAVQVDVIGEIVEYRRWSGARIDLGAKREGSLTVRPGTDFGLAPKGATVSDPRLLAELVPEGGGAVLHVSVKDGAAPGPVSAQVRANLVVEGRGKPPRPFTDSLWVTGKVQ